MKRIFAIALGLMLVLFAIPASAAKNSQTIKFPADVRVGQSQLAQGSYEVSWVQGTGDQVQLTLTDSHKKTTTLAARQIEEKQNSVGVTTNEVGGAQVLTEIHTTKLRFVLAEAAK